MSLEEIYPIMFNGDPLHDAISAGILFVCFMAFYSAIFGGLFSLFKYK